MAQLENESIEVIRMLQREVKNTKNLLREKEATLLRAEHIVAEFLDDWPFLC